MSKDPWTEGNPDPFEGKKRRPDFLQLQKRPKPKDGELPILVCKDCSGAFKEYRHPYFGVLLRQVETENHCAIC